MYMYSYITYRSCNPPPLPPPADFKGKISRDFQKHLRQNEPLSKRESLPIDREHYLKKIISQELYFH